ncbi:hypothetical protein NCS52_00757000 [Fusarium sp. LHS14.1]|nr:hypothetical protein NCS52_00757000 [Fusarium sp. LHS14.1]
MATPWAAIPEPPPMRSPVSSATGQRMARSMQLYQCCVSIASSPRPVGSTGLRRLDQSVDVRVELERRAAAERKARRKTHRIKSKERVDVEEGRGEFEVEGYGPDGLLLTDSSEGVDQGFRITGGSTDITDPIIEVSKRADENPNNNHISTLSASLGGNAVGGADTSEGVRNSIAIRLQAEM